MLSQLKIRLWLSLALLCVARLASADAFDPPPTYYNTATGSGVTLKAQLQDIIDNHTVRSYDDARFILQVTDADPAQPGHMIVVYDRVSENVAEINPGGLIPGWDGGMTWNREHTWPQSRQVGNSGPDRTDLFNLRPSFPGSNSDRGNLNFGGAFGSRPGGKMFGALNDGGTVWYPGDADAGMIARQEFYMAVRYDGSDANTTNLELFAGNPAESQGLGNLTRMIEWHFAAPPDDFERRRNQIIFDDYQHNRNPFTDRPELVWSIFVDQANDSRIAIAGTTVGADGASTREVDLGRVFVGGAVPAAQSLTLNKTGMDGTYFEVTTSGAATSSLAGRFNAFRTNQSDSKSIEVGLNTNTSTAGLRSGTVTIDNLDITTGGGAGRGANDANDVFDVSLTVLHHATPSFSGGSELTTLFHDFGSFVEGAVSPTFNFDVFNFGILAAFTADLDFDSLVPAGDASSFLTNLSPAAGALTLAGGASANFDALISTATAGEFAAAYTLWFSDEDLPGALTKSLSLVFVGEVTMAGDFNFDGSVDVADYSVWRDGLGSTFVAEDFELWKANFGRIAGGVGAFTGAAASVPEPATWLLVLSAITTLGRRNRCLRGSAL